MAPDTRTRLFEIAARMFYEQGYEKTALSDIADALGVRKASIYYYIESKEDLLEKIMWESCEAIIHNMQETGDIEGDPAHRLRAFARGHVTKVLVNPRPNAIFVRDFAALAPDRQKRILSHRDGYEAFLAEIVAEGREAGVFDDSNDLMLTVKAVLGMLHSASVWFRPGGRLRPQEVAEGYAQLALQLVGANAVARAELAA